MKKQSTGRKRYLFVDMFISFILLSTAAAQVKTTPYYDLARLSPDWVTVLGGSILSQPVRTSYGFAALGEGKMLSAFNQNGTVLWQRSFVTPVQMNLSVGAADMLYVITGKTTLNMLNPGGLVLWSADTGFTVANAPLPGRDGRVFVMGTERVACYGINGIRRWFLDTEALDPSFSPVELNDGSLLLFLNKRSSGKSIATRISPFGAVLEQIVFTGKVVQATSCKDGALLVFSDGSAGLCAVRNKAAVSEWVLSAPEQGLSAPSSVTVDGLPEGTAALISGNPAKICVVNTKTGAVTNSFRTTSINAAQLTYAGAIPSGILVSDQTNALCCMADGSIVWEAKFSPLKKWNYLFATDNGYLAFCGTNWVIEAYRMTQSLVKSASSFKERQIEPYRTFYAGTTETSSSLTGRIITPQTSAQMGVAFAQGDFGEYEPYWLELLENELSALSLSWGTASKSHLVEQPYFTTHIPYAEEVLSLAGSSGCAVYGKYIIPLLQNANDNSLLQMLVTMAGSLGYDPDGQLLAALDVLLHHTSPKNQQLLLPLCDSVYEICRYMGRPAFFERGEQMLSELLYPQYDAKVRDYARKTLSRIAALKL